MYTCVDNNRSIDWGDRDLVIWGMGVGGINRYMELISSSSSMVSKIKGFTDSYSTKPTDRVFCGKRIITLDELTKDKDKYSIIISTKVKQYIEDILLSLQEMGITDHVYVFTTPYKPKYNLQLLEENSEKIEKVRARLQDERSKEVFDNLLNYRKDFKLSWLAASVDSGVPQYFDPIVSLSDEEVFVDCGTYCGDTINQFAALQEKYKRIYAFEPNPEIYQIMLSMIETKKHQNVVTYQKGVMDKKSIIRFSESVTSGAAVCEAGGQEIETVCLDDELLDCGNKITFVKMDIEGVESEALSGMKKIIERDKPKLAICVYHKEEDLWELPLQILSMNPDYKIYLRHYSENLYTETVCYAI